MKKIIFMFIIVMLFLGMVMGQNHIISSVNINDPYEGQILNTENRISSSRLSDTSSIDYGIEQAFDGRVKTAWCVKGFKNEWAKVHIPESQYIQDKGIMNVYRIVMYNGLCINKNLYISNNRIKKIKAEFSGGQTRILELKDGTLEEQKFRINIKAKWVKLTILEIYRGSKYNDTCISDIRFETTTHPSEMTDIQRKNWGYD